MSAALCVLDVCLVCPQVRVTAAQGLFWLCLLNLLLSPRASLYTLIMHVPPGEKAFEGIRLRLKSYVPHGEKFTELS